MKEYLKLLNEIKSNGEVKKGARANMPDTISRFGDQYRIKLKDGFPALTTKKLFWKGVVVELLWFIKGKTNIKYLVDNGANFWNEDAYNYYLRVYETIRYSPTKLSYQEFVTAIKDNKHNHTDYSYFNNNKYKLGDCGEQYGKLWRSFEGVDQLKGLVTRLIDNPESRRHIINAWNPSTLKDMALPPCHTLSQFNTSPLSIDARKAIIDEDGVSTHKRLDSVGLPKYRLDCKLYQRSGDVFLGVPMNLASYSLLTHIIAEIVNMIPGDFIHTFGDAHIYLDQTDAVNTQLDRKPTKLPNLKISEEFTSDVIKWHKGKISFNDLINNINPDWFTLSEYNHQSTIKAPLSTGLIK